MPSSMTPGSFVIVMVQVSDAEHRLRRDLSGSALPKFPQSASRGARLSRLPGLLTLRPARLLAPLRRIEPVSRPQRAFTSRLPADWSPALPLDMTTTWTGLLVLAGLSPAGMAASLAAPNPIARRSRDRDRPTEGETGRIQQPAPRGHRARRTSGRRRQRFHEFRALA